MMNRFVWTAATVFVFAAGVSTPYRAAPASIEGHQADVPGQDRFRAADDEVIMRTLRYADGGEPTLDVRAIHGSIQVVGTDEADVQLEVRRSIRAESEEDLRAAEREVSLDIAEKGANIEAIVRERDNEICGESSDGRSREWRRPRYRVTFDFAIRVPRRTRLRLCTINGGEVVIEGMAGDFAVDNVNGRIVMENIRGAGTARTVNGTIVASFTERPRAASEFRTTNGNVVVTFPTDLAANLKMKTFHGGLFTDFDVESLPQPAAVAERRGGQFVYRTNQFTQVRAGRGGPELTFETLNGDVRVLRAAR